jgi:hypothetical protein
MKLDLSDRSTWPSRWERWVEQPTEYYEGPEYGAFDTLLFGPRGRVDVYSPPDGSGYAESYIYYRAVREAYFDEEMIRVIPETLDPALAGQLGTDIGRRDLGEIVTRHRNGEEVSHAPKSGVSGWLSELRSRLAAFAISPTVSLRPEMDAPQHEIDVREL